MRRLLLVSLLVLTGCTGCVHPHNYSTSNRVEVLPVDTITPEQRQQANQKLQDWIKFCSPDYVYLLSETPTIQPCPPIFSPQRQKEKI